MRGQWPALGWCAVEWRYLKDPLTPPTKGQALGQSHRQRRASAKYKGLCPLSSHWFSPSFSSGVVRNSPEIRGVEEQGRGFDFKRTGQGIP